MADDPRGGRGYPPRENHEDPHYLAQAEDEDDRRSSRQLPPVASAPGAALPPMQYQPPGQAYPPEQRYAEPQRYAADPRYAQSPDSRYGPAPRYEQRHPSDPRYVSDQRSWSSESPTNPNGYSAPPESRNGYPPPPEGRNGYPPPSDSRSGYPPPPDGRSGYPPPQESRGGYHSPPDGRNGYHNPPADGRYNLPPVQPAPERPRYDDRRQLEDRGRYEEPPRRYEDRPPYDDRRYEGRGPPQYAGDHYYANQPPPPPPQGRSGGYGPDSYGYGYPRHPGPYPYGQGPPAAAQPPQPQAAPRQRTSIACRYCRKRKIRCSGYANTTNGKCTNCDKLRIDCVFQPVSSNSSTAFVPVSAVPGGVPPGTPLYGAYGQPLGPIQQQRAQSQLFQAQLAAMQSQQSPSQSQTQSQTQSQPQQAQQSQQQRIYPAPASDYAPSLQSPTSQYAPYDEGEPGRRRARPPDDGHAMRLPPPNYPADEDPRRRSPVSNPSNGTSPTSYHGYQQSGYEQDRSPTPHRNSPGGASAPAVAVQQQLQTPSQTPSVASSSSNPMSLDRLMGPDPGDRKPGSDIDQNMLGRLNRRN